MKFIIEVWCSPLRMEHYKQSVIDISSTMVSHYCLDDLKEWLDSDFFYEAFGENYSKVGGLHKVVCQVEMRYVETVDWEGIPDGWVEIQLQNILFQGKCQDFNELKWAWLELNGRTDEYFHRMYPYNGQ